MLLLCCTFVVLLQIININASYIIPEPVIIAYEPKGIEISIPDEDGVILFAFHANVNREMKYLEAGQISRDITKKTGNRWVFKDKHQRLKVGDTLYYWLFVIRDELGYRRDDGKYVVHELIPRGGRNRPTSTSTTTVPPPSNCENNIITTQKTETTTSYLAICEQTLTNLTDNYVELLSKHNDIVANNVIMKDIIERDPDGRRLKLSGNIPDTNDPLYDVSFILNEKFSLSPKILTAYRLKDNSISFEVSLEDKVSIIRKQIELSPNVTSIRVSY